MDEAKYIESRLKNKIENLVEELLFDELVRYDETWIQVIVRGAITREEIVTAFSNELNRYSDEKLNEMIKEEWSPDR